MIKLLIFISALIAVSNAAKILGIFPTMAKSHYIVGSALMKGLAERGHEVTVISPFPQKTPLKNYRDINTPSVIEATQAIMDRLLIDMNNQGIFERLVSIFGMGITLTNLTFQEPAVQKLLNSNEQFDLVILEVFVNEAYLGFGHRFNAPIIGVGTFGASMWACEMVGSPSPPSYVPSPFLSFTDRMSLIERIGNLVVTFFDKIYYDNFYLPKQVDIYNQYFHGPKPTLHEIQKNVSLVLLNSHFSIGLPRPYLPNMIEVGGMHVNRKANKLPSDILQFIESAKDGVVYFSMGSNLKSRILPIEKRNAILNTFKSLKQKVLWKWEDKELPGKPDNVFISDWFPQDDILAHPNVKVFITHGGLLSTTEAIYHGVPIIGIPMFGDQPLNMARATKAGFGLTVEYNNLNEITLKAALTKVLNSDKYVKNIKEFSARYKDQPLTPLDTAVYWVEYVIRHKGASHMKSAAQQLSFIQYHNLDALSIIFGAIFLIIYLIYAMIMKCLCMGRKKQQQQPQSVQQKKKRN